MLTYLSREKKIKMKNTFFQSIYSIILGIKTIYFLYLIGLIKKQNDNIITNNYTFWDNWPVQLNRNIGHYIIKNRDL